MTRVIDFQAEKERSALKRLLGMLWKSEQYSLRLDLTNSLFSFGGYGMADRDDSEKDKLRLLVYNKTDVGGDRLVGAVKLTREQWEEIKAKGDRLLDFADGRANVEE